MSYVTSFGAEGYEQYGAKFLESWVENVRLPLVVYVEHSDAMAVKNAYGTQMETRNLWDIPGCREFVDACAFPAMEGKIWNGNRNYRFDVKKFCRKSFAQIDAAAQQETGWMYWVDADIEWTAPPEIPETDDFMMYLGRPEWHSCASFVGWNLDHPVSADFWQAYFNMYMTGTVFALPEWTDCHVLDFLRRQMKFSAKDLAAGVDREKMLGPANVFDMVFPQGHHKKGHLKNITLEDAKARQAQAESVGQLPRKLHANRYEELETLVNHLRPERILEIGTWNGTRAARLCQWGAEYTGFDLFETATDETDADEKNVKRHFSVSDVSVSLAKLDIKHHLHKGNTRFTLPAWGRKHRSNAMDPYDFAFIDGGHSVETIQSDWDNVKTLMKPGGVVVFDDYYEDMPGTDLTKFGANEVVKDLHFELSESADPVVGGGVTRLAVLKCP